MKLRILSEQLGLELSKKREDRLRKMSFQEVSAHIDALQLRVDCSGNLKTREVIDGMATNRQLRSLFRLREQAQNPVKGDELISIKAASVEEVRKATQTAQTALHDYNDRHGVPIPQWRFLRGLYTDEVLHRNGISGVAKSKTPMTIDQLRALHVALTSQAERVGSASVDA